MRDSAAWPEARRKTALRPVVGKQAGEHISRSRVRLLDLVIALKAILVLRLACHP